MYPLDDCLYETRGCKTEKEKAGPDAAGPVGHFVSGIYGVAAWFSEPSGRREINLTGFGELPEPGAYYLNNGIT
ncbi:hypothetical protein [Rufibacter aurantiacus]|uniref:hypothetical protein n=1 Tax=Rufibacter aurantiacus TaxID=2817374 RepID=UPI001B30D1A4|nr:hypothetical protein [Rufibacter aurantiacus]